MNVRRRCSCCGQMRTITKPAPRPRWFFNVKKGDSLRDPWGNQRRVLSVTYNLNGTLRGVGLNRLAPGVAGCRKGSHTWRTIITRSPVVYVATDLRRHWRYLGRSK